MTWGEFPAFVSGLAWGALLMSLLTIRMLARLATNLAAAMAAAMKDDDEDWWKTGGAAHGDDD